MSSNKTKHADDIGKKTLESYSKGKWTGSPSPVALAGNGFSYTGRDKVIECSECKVSVDLAAEDLVTLPTHDKDCKIEQHLKGIITPDEQSNSSTVAPVLSEPKEPSKGKGLDPIRQNIDRNNDFSELQGTPEQCESPKGYRRLREQHALEVVSHFDGNHRRNIDDTDTRHQTRSGLFMVAAKDDNNSFSDRVKSDLRVYTTLHMIRRAPSRCFCSKCKGYAYSSFTGLGNRDMSGISVLSEKTLVLKMKRNMKSSPMHPDFADKNDRKESFEKEGITSDNISLQTEAGFFCNGLNDICCFCCGLGLREELLSYDPWREHARWCPVCPFLLEKKTEEFVHDVINETSMLKEYLQDRDRCPQMSTRVVEEALMYYPQAIIQSMIQDFFLDNGGFPRHDELFSALEAKTLWRTGNKRILQ